MITITLLLTALACALLAGLVGLLWATAAGLLERNRKALRTDDQPTLRQVTTNWWDPSTTWRRR